MTAFGVERNGRSLGRFHRVYTVYLVITGKICSKRNQGSPEGISASLPLPMLNHSGLPSALRYATCRKSESASRFQSQHRACLDDRVYGTYTGLSTTCGKFPRQQPFRHKNSSILNRFDIKILQNLLSQLLSFRIAQRR